jgi:hypothetical protein
VNCAYVYLVRDGGSSYRIESSVWILVVCLMPLVWSHTCDSEQSLDLSPRQRQVLVVVAIALWLLVLTPRLGSSFVSDDFVFLDVYRRPGDVLSPTEFFRPLFAAVFWALATIGRRTPMAFHGLALALHAASAALVYGLARRLFHDDTTPTICGLIFLLSPLQLEATLWIAGLQELLWTFLVLCALWRYTKDRVLSARALAAVAAFVAAALLSKETAICFVLLLPAADLALYRLGRGPMLGRGYLVLAAIAVVYLIVRANFAATHASFLAVPPRYFLKQLVDTPYAAFSQPWNADAVHMLPIIPAALSVLLVALLFVRAAVRRTSRQLLAGPAVILMTTLPVYSYFYVGADLASARYLYFATAGWAVLVAQLLTVIRHRIALAAAVATVVIGSFLFLRVNVRPWDVADAVVTTMRDAALHGHAPLEAAEMFATSRGITLQWKNGVPESFEGVTIFRNGYPEFLRSAGERK